MITTLLRQDPAMGLGALLMRFFFPLSLIAAVRWEFGPQGPGLLWAFALSTVLLWLATIGPLGQGRIRVFEYQLPLPISARKLVALRLAVHLLPGLGLFAIALMLMSPSMFIGSRPLLQFAAFCCAWVCFVLCLFAWQPNRPRIDSSWVYALLAILGALILALPFFVPRLALFLTLPSGA